MESLPDLALERIFVHLPWQDVVQISRVCKSWCAAARVSTLWRELFTQRFRLPCITFPKICLGGDFTSAVRETFSYEPSCSALETFKEWHRFVRQPFHPGIDPLIQARTLSAWAAVLPADFPRARVEQRMYNVNKIVNVFGAQVSPATLSLLLHSPASYHFGSYQFYDHAISLETMDFDEDITVHNAIGENPFFRFGVCQYRRKHVLLFPDGSLKVLNSNRHFVDISPAGQPDSALRWLETYAAHVRSNSYCFDPDLGRLSLFPRHPTLQSTQVTCGIRITVSTIFAPELSSAAQPLIAYHIDMDLLPPADIPVPGLHEHVTPEAVEFTHITTTQGCRLRSRRWCVRDATGAEDIVEGLGVVGHFPFLSPETPHFHYESCSQMRTPPGTMSGHFTFELEGSDALVDIIVPQFHLRVLPFSM